MKRIFAIVALAPLVYMTALPVGNTAGIDPDETTAIRLDSLFVAAEKQGFHGNVLVSRNNKTLLFKGYGYANIASGMRFEPSTLVQIGSNVKDFTKVAVFQLIEQGKLHLHDSLGMFIENLAPDVSGITVKHLLYHRSGLPLSMGGDDYPLTEAEMIQQLRTLKPAFEPGKQEKYSNIGYSLLAYLIGKTTGETYDAYVARHILVPAGLKETGSYIPDFDRARIAHGYSGNMDKGTILDKPHDSEGHYWNLRGNGGYLSTLSDMQRFYKALEDSTLLSEKEHREEVFARDESVMLAGSDMVCFFMFANLPELGAEVIIASNHGEFKGNQLFDKIKAVLGNKAVKNVPQVPATMHEQLPENNIGKMIGAYLEAYNSGDTAVMHRFFNRYTATGNPDSPPINARIERYREMFGNLGRLTFIGFRQSPEDEGWEIRVSTSSLENATLTFITEKEPSGRLIGMRVLVGD